MGLCTAHGRSSVPWDARDLPRAGREELDNLRPIFGVDLEMIERWRSKYASDTTQAMYSGGAQASRSQYDRIFQITALNRQIDLLERKFDRKGGTRGGFLYGSLCKLFGKAWPHHKDTGEKARLCEELRGVLSKQRAQRARLLEVLYQAGRNDF